MRSITRPDSSCHAQYHTVRYFMPCAVSHGPTVHAMRSVTRPDISCHAQYHTTRHFMPCAVSHGPTVHTRRSVTPHQAQRHTPHNGHGFIINTVRDNNCINTKQAANCTREFDKSVSECNSITTVTPRILTSHSVSLLFISHRQICTQPEN
jgi:hypothetical protein